MLTPGALRRTTRALMWFTIGAYSGDNNAMQNHVIAAESMTPQQIGEARKMAKDCLGKRG
jgi:hypothetical protein